MSELSVYGMGGKHPLDEYKEHLGVPQWHPATVDEWADWAERMVAAYEAELQAAKNDYERAVESFRKSELDAIRMSREMAALEQRVEKLEEIRFWAKSYMNSMGADIDSRRSARAGLMKALAAQEEA